MQFKPFPKVPRFAREVVITEKIDGTNASVGICNGDVVAANGHNFKDAVATVQGDYYELFVFAGSRSRWLQPGKQTDNHGFAEWVKDHAEELVGLGEGHHFGEWWGKGINRGYGLDHKRFSLFNVHRWSDDATRPACCHVVPVLERLAEPTSWRIQDVLYVLEHFGSVAAPDFMRPEGIMIYHTAANQLFKMTIENDQEPKSKANR